LKRRRPNPSEPGRTDTAQFNELGDLANRLRHSFENLDREGAPAPSGAIWKLPTAQVVVVDQLKTVDERAVVQSV
jgi:hypothetical protein